MRVIPYKCLPATLPTHAGLTLYLLLEHFQTPPSTRWVLWGVYGVWFLLHFVAICTQEPRDPWTALR